MNFYCCVVHDEYWLNDFKMENREVIDTFPCFVQFYLKYWALVVFIIIHRLKENNYNTSITNQSPVHIFMKTGTYSGKKSSTYFHEHWYMHCGLKHMSIDKLIKFITQVLKVQYIWALTLSHTVSASPSYNFILYRWNQL